jgi:hypothetical protein
MVRGAMNMEQTKATALINYGDQREVEIDFTWDETKEPLEQLADSLTYWYPDWSSAVITLIREQTA